MSFRTQHLTYPSPPPFQFLPLQSITMILIHAPMLIRWPIPPRPNRGYQKLKKFMHLQFSLFLRRICVPYRHLWLLYVIRIRSCGAGLWDQRPQVQAIQKSNGRDHLQLRLHLQEKVITRKRPAWQAMGKGNASWYVFMLSPSLSINQWINVLSVGEHAQSDDKYHKYDSKFRDGQKPNCGNAQ